jgi:uncharacterized spore protein YtfJ
MEIRETIERVLDGMAVRRVFGEPYEHEGLTLVPVAAVRGGGGGGGGESPDGQGSGSGGGFGLVARPVGVYIVRDDDVEWRPAVDVTRIVLGGQLVGIVALLTLRAVVKALARG